MKRVQGYFRSLLAAAVASAASIASAQIAVDSLTGPVTSNEISSFKSYMAGRTMSNDNIGNDWVYGNQGKDTEALGMMYEITGDRAILDRMIQFADHALSIRNNATTGRIIWTGRRELCWPNKDTTAEDAKYCGSENGDVAGHTAYCARLILETPSIWSMAVAVGDPHGYGATYKARALKYVAEMDRTMDTFMTPNFILASDASHYRWPDTASYGALGARYQSARGNAIPWNQQTMISNAYIQLAQCHEILADAPARVASYYTYVRSNIQWFLSDLHPATRDGYSVYDWGYSLGRTSEDTGHGGYDIWGLCRAYDRGNNNISRTTMVNFANTLAFVIYDDATNTYFQRVNGVTGGDANRSYIGASWTCLAPYRTSPLDLHLVTAASNRSRAATNPLDAAYIFRNKHLRLGSTPTPTPRPTSTPTPAATPTPTPTVPAGDFTEITPGAFSVTASTHDGNVPGNTVDDNLGTRWSANGDGQWIQYDLGSARTVAFVRIAFYSGNTRASRFDLQTSLDGTTWSNALTGALSSGGSLAEETFDFSDRPAQFVRYLGHGNSVNAWNSVTELSLFTPATGGPLPTSTPEPGPSGYYKLIARHSGKAVTVASASTANGANVAQWTYGGTATNDEWQLVDLGTGYHRIVNRNSGKVLNVAGASTANAGNVDQYSWSGASQQQWQVTDLGTGYFRLTVRHSGKVLNVSGVSTADGANIDQWSWASVNQQQFQIVSVP